MHGRPHFTSLECAHDMTGKPQTRASSNNHPKTILVPIDFSAASKEAFSRAIALAGERSRIILLHVVAPSAEGDLSPAKTAGASGQRLTAFWKANGAGSPFVHSQLRIGTPFREILKCAEENKAEMIVLAVHDATALGAALGLGHTVDRVTRYAPCPVLLVRERSGSPDRAKALI